MTSTQPTPKDAPRHHAGTRTCAGCGARVDAERVRSELVHLVLVDGGAGLEAHVDLGAKGVGRGAWVHARRECLARAAQRGLAKSARAAVRASAAQLELEIAAQADRRVEGLLAAARRRRLLAVGADAVSEALGRQAGREGSVSLCVVATDAAAAASQPAVVAAMVGGRALRWGDKARLGACVGRGDVGVVAVCEDGIAAALRQAIGLSETFAGALDGGAVRQVAEV